uniref:Putative secreted peptide n=1 Tax=Anopheles braziliensis TaxID=58242 RepID=A0A2M3ZTH9_9DIPT
MHSVLLLLLLSLTDHQPPVRRLQRTVDVHHHTVPWWKQHLAQLEEEAKSDDGRDDGAYQPVLVVAGMKRPLDYDTSVRTDSGGHGGDDGRNAVDASDSLNPT